TALLVAQLGERRRLPLGDELVSRQGRVPGGAAAKQFSFPPTIVNIRVHLLRLFPPLPPSLPLFLPQSESCARFQPQPGSPPNCRGRPHMAVRIEAHSEPIPGYRLLDRLGAGGFGEVWRAEAPGGIFKAIKIIHGDLRSQDADLVRYAEQELKALKRVKQVRHPYLLALDRYDIVDGRLMIVMELADCNLWDRFRACRDRGLPGIPRDELLVYMAETAEVLDLFNDQFQLQHLDIKTQNLFLLYNHVKAADFGQVKDLQGLMAQVTGGISPVYAAPETFDGLITRYCDQYSLACVYQELLTG